MIHFHHVHGGCASHEIPEFLRGRCGLVSFEYQSYLGAALENCNRVVLDNGAFTAWQRGEEVDFEGFVEWVRSLCRHPRIEWALIPDSISGDAERNDELLASWPAELRPYGVPIWHPHEPIARFVRLCNDWRTVAIGGSDSYPRPGSSAWWGRIAPAMDEVTDEAGRPLAELHGLRLMDPEIFGELPLSSADSSNAVRNASQIHRFGTYPPATAAQRANQIANRIEAHLSPATWEKQNQGCLFSGP